MSTSVGITPSFRVPHGTYPYIFVTFLKKNLTLNFQAPRTYVIVKVRLLLVRLARFELASFRRRILSPQCMPFHHSRMLSYTYSVLKGRKCGFELP